VFLAGAYHLMIMALRHGEVSFVGGFRYASLPAAALLGGTLLTVADTVARVAVAPRQLPVGVLTALLGVPTFLLLLHRRR
jgi:iron complex transport system permease protein